MKRRVNTMAQRRMKPVTALTSALENAVFKYESDTFSAAGEGITKQEARQVQNKLVRGIIQHLDGIQISEALNQVRRQG